MSKGFNYGGQAVIEGVMMRGPKELAIAVRTPDNNITLHTEEVKTLGERFPFLKLPFLRGVVVLIESLVLGVKALTYSANQAVGEETEQLSSKEIFFTVALALTLGILLFFVAPTTIVHFLRKYVSNSFVFNLIEGLVRLGIFVLYVVGISLIKDIQRVFQYHGAEHKTIHAYENGDELTVEKVRPYTTLHPGCGTSFLLIVMAVSIIIFAFLGQQVLWMRILSRLVLLPVVAGVSYEFLKFSRKRCQSWWVKMLIAPGLWLQRLTTREPDDDQIEVAIAALKPLLPQES